MPTPNIFDYATKELSQDAFICWLIACAKDGEGVLQSCGRAFISTLMKHGRESYGRPCVVTDVSLPDTQYKGIDVYFQARVDGSMVSFVIEDKTDSSMHSDQLERYRDAVRCDDRPEDEFRLVYYKTGYVYDDEREQAKEAGYTVFEAKDMQRFLDLPAAQAAIPNHEILGQYQNHLNRIIAGREEARERLDRTQGFIQYKFMFQPIVHYLIPTLSNSRRPPSRSRLAASSTRSLPFEFLVR